MEDKVLSSNQYIFLLSSERGGSNFITRLMNKHSMINGPAPKHLINPVARNYFRYGNLGQKENWEALVADIFHLFSVEFSHWEIGLTQDELIGAVQAGDLSGLINYVFSKETFAHNKQYCFVKEIKTYEIYPFLKQYFSDASYVYLARDPRDMALSWKKSKTHKGGIVTAARQWKNDQQQYLKIAALEREAGRLVFVRYEDLIKETRANAQKILDLKNLDFEENMLEADQDKLTHLNAKTQEPWNNLTKAILRDNSNKFEKELSPDEIAFIEHICYFEMLQLGYEPKNDWASLQEISGARLDAYHLYEQKTLTYIPSPGIVENMKAKQRFYQHIAENKVILNK